MTPERAKELKECPFCGNEAELDCDVDGCRAGCSSCDIYTEISQDYTVPMDTWNHRVDLHFSDCATHNEPAYLNGKCDCGYIEASD